MTTQPTNNSVPSESPRDLKFNAAKIDEFATSTANEYQDRFGNPHYTIEGLRWLAQQSISKFGYIPLDSFQIGANITLPNQMLRDASTGEYYRWDGSLPINVPAGSTPQTFGGVGVGKWVGVGSGALGSSQDGAGDALIAVKQPFSGAVVRTQHSKNSDTLSVKDFGIKGDGTDESVAWLAMISNLPSGSTTLRVPAGNYVCNTPIALVYAKLPTLVVDSEAELLPARSFSAFLNVQYRKRDETKFGAGIASAGSLSSGGGFKVGGGSLMESGDGMFLSSDGHANWMRVQTSKKYNPSEMVVYPSSTNGTLLHQSQNILTWKSGGKFDISGWSVGDAIYAFNRALLITSLTSETQIGVTEIGGGSLSTAIGTVSAFHYVYTTAAGVCDISSGVCTRKSGDPFFFFGYGSGAYRLWINGVVKTVSSVSNNGNTLTLTDSTLNASNAAYKIRDDINAQLSTIRVQKTPGENEENLTISARANGEYEIRAGISGSGYYYPIRFYNGEFNNSPHKSMEIASNGFVGVTSNSSAPPSAPFSVTQGLNSALNDGMYHTLTTLKTITTNGSRQMDFGWYGDGGFMGGYMQGGDQAGNPYTISINPKGGYVGILTKEQPIAPLDVNGAIAPHVNNTFTCGTSSYKWSAVYATNGTIQTSDEREKNIEVMTSAEINAAYEVAKSVIPYTWKNNPKSNGVGERRIGMSVQKVMEIMEKNGLNWKDYSMFSYDEETDRYGMNYSEVLSFALAGVAAKL